MLKSKEELERIEAYLNTPTINFGDMKDIVIAGLRNNGYEVPEGIDDKSLSILTALIIDQNTGPQSNG